MELNSFVRFLIKKIFAKLKAVVIGWTKIFMFYTDLQLNSGIIYLYYKYEYVSVLFFLSMLHGLGRFRVNLRKPPVVPALGSIDLQRLPTVKNMEVRFRIIDGRLKRRHDLIIPSQEEYSNKSYHSSGKIPF